VGPIVTASPTPSAQRLLVTYDSKSSIEKSVAQPAFDLMNECYSSGKLKSLWLAHKFVSFNTVFEVSPHTREDAFNEYVKNAPYLLELHWYSTYKSVVGYTYNFKNDDWDGSQSETRIWTNSRIMWGATAKEFAEHWAHELSHQARAGGFVHYTIHEGSTPYEAGNIMAECLK
jgi:hypothetical protein